jgi:translation initiation factor IF-3
MCLLLCADAESIRVFLTVFQEVLSIASADYQFNEDIRDREIRLIGDDGEQLGIMPAAEALEIAYSKNLDLVKIAPGSNPPVCKIMDYGKYRFAQAKRDKEAKKNQHIIEIKEIRMSPSIGENDFVVKLKNAQKFLSEGNRVKVTVRFRGREMAHTNIGEELLRRFAAECAELGALDKQPNLEGRNMSVFISPKIQTPPKKIQKSAEDAQTTQQEESGPDEA